MVINYDVCEGAGEKAHKEIGWQKDFKGCCEHDVSAYGGQGTGGYSKGFEVREICKKKNIEGI